MQELSDPNYSPNYTSLIVFWDPDPSSAGLEP
jgi:hypothetical protein